MYTFHFDRFAPVDEALYNKLVKAKDGSGIVGYKDTPVLPWCGYHVHDPDRPAPRKVRPGRRRAAAGRGMRVTNYGEFLERHPAEGTARGRGWRNSW